MAGGRLEEFCSLQMPYDEKRVDDFTVLDAPPGHAEDQMAA